MHGAERLVEDDSSRVRDGEDEAEPAVLGSMLLDVLVVARDREAEGNGVGVELLELVSGAKVHWSFPILRGADLPSGGSRRACVEGRISEGLVPWRRRLTLKEGNDTTEEHDRFDEELESLDKVWRMRDEEVGVPWRKRAGGEVRVGVHMARRGKDGGDIGLVEAHGPSCTRTGESVGDESEPEGYRALMELLRVVRGSEQIRFGVERFAIELRLG